MNQTIFALSLAVVLLAILTNWRAVGRQGWVHAGIQLYLLTIISWGAVIGRVLL